MNIKASSDLTFAYQNNTLVSVMDVPSGLGCNCICPACEGQLIAKKGAVNQHHFAHYESENCGKGVETVIHLLAKKAIDDYRIILLPGDQTLSRLAYVEQECRQLGFISDISTAIEGTGELVEIEIKVTHAVDDEKLSKVRKLGVKMIEIDMSPLLYSFESKEQLIAYVIAEADRVWLSTGNDANDAESLDLEDNSPAPAAVSWIATGYKYATGYSAKNKKEFTFAALHVLKKMEGYSSNNYTIHSMGGYEITDLRIDTNQALLDKLDTLTFPVELVLESEPRQTERGIEYCVIDVRM